MSRGLFAYHQSGRVFAVAHEREVLAHEGESEAPLWRKTLHGEVARLDFAGDELVALTKDGDLARYALDGKVRSRSALGAEVEDAAARGDGCVAVAHPMRVSILRRGDLVPTELPFAGVRALAWSGDGSRLLLAEGSRLIELSASSWEEAREPVDAGAPVEAIAWSPSGAWLAGAGDRVLKIAPGASEATRLTRAEGMTITDLAVALDGKRFAMQLGEDTVAVLDDPPGETVGQLVYPEMRVRGVRFGPAPWMGVALHLGDANKLNLSTGAVHRSDTHPGRPHHRWLVEVAGSATKQAERPKPAPKSTKPKPAKPRPVAAPSYDEPYDPPPDPGISPITAIRLVLFAFALLMLAARACH